MSRYQVLLVICLVLAAWWLQTQRSCSLHKFFIKDENSQCFLLVVPLDHREKTKLGKFFPDFSIIKRGNGIFSCSGTTLRMVAVSVTMT